MVIAHDTEAALQAAVELVNSGAEPDTLTSTAWVDAWYAKHRYTGHRARDAAELAELRAARPELRALLTADRDAAAEMINRMLARAGAVPQLIRHDGIDWHIHAVAAERTPGAARHGGDGDGHGRPGTRRRDVPPVGLRCSENCDGIVLDLTRNRSRRFCGTACANRVAVAAYRARARAARP
nr:CGNR zinc finger domain-containing protein [Actinoplanes digitatis]